jgi:hypothetical protein
MQTYKTRNLDGRYKTGADAGNMTHLNTQLPVKSYGELDRTDPEYKRKLNPISKKSARKLRKQLSKNW